MTHELDNAVAHIRVNDHLLEDTAGTDDKQHVKESPAPYPR